MKHLKKTDNVAPNLLGKILWRFLLTVVGFVAIAGCSMANQLENKNSLSKDKPEIENNVSKPGLESSQDFSNYKLVKQKNISVDPNIPSEIAQNIPKEQEFTDNEDNNDSISLTSPEEKFGGKTGLYLSSTERTNAVGNPIYRLDLYANGILIKSYDTVTGRHNTQQRDRHVSGTEAPLPNGSYAVASYPIGGTHSEVGELFLPITPQFKTGRSALGFHYDPSYEKENGEDGTAGCIAFKNKEQFDNFIGYLYQHNFPSLIVEIQ